jgi:hypothetical protein
MKTRYRAKAVLTSLALVLALAAAAPPKLPPLDCGAAHRLYSQRMLRRARAVLLLELAREHERRAAVILGATDDFQLPPQETASPRLKHLLAILATKC